MNFLDRLNHLMKVNKIKSRRQLAIRSGLSYSTIESFYSQGYENIRLKTLMSLAQFFRCSLDELIGDEELPKDLTDREIIHGYTELNDANRQIVADLIKALKSPDQ